MQTRYSLIRRLTLYFSLVAFLVSSISYPVRGASKIPGIKKGKNLHTQETYVGKIKSIDTKERVLVLTPTEGDQEENFEYEKGVRVVSAHKSGELKVTDLTVGMLVTLYLKNAKNSSRVYQILIM